jgi:hypothetical protein
VAAVFDRAAGKWRPPSSLGFGVQRPRSRHSTWPAPADHHIFWSRHASRLRQLPRMTSRQTQRCSSSQGASNHSTSAICDCVATIERPIAARRRASPGPGARRVPASWHLRLTPHNHHPRFMPARHPARRKQGRGDDPQGRRAAYVKPGHRCRVVFMCPRERAIQIVAKRSSAGMLLIRRKRSREPTDPRPPGRRDQALAT